MTHNRILEYLLQQEAPTDKSPEAIKEWHEHNDVGEFLSRSTVGDVPLVVFAKGLYMYSIAVPLSALKEEFFVEDVGKWNFSVPSGYGYGYGFGADGGLEEFVSEPLEGHTSSKTLDSGTALFFLRSFDGREPRKSYLEINPKLSHVLGLHWMEDESAWCDMNRRGEVVPKARYVIKGDVSFCTLDREELDFYLFLTKSCLVRCFDVTRSLDWMKYGLRTEEIGRVADSERQIFADLRAEMGSDGVPQSSFLRGFQVLKNEQPRERMLLKLKGDEPRKYESFVIWDWKHKRVCEWSTEPAKIGNYFVKSDLPYGTSPAFFKPDVLLQYKQDPVRYTISERTINCRGGWSLQYDINDEGQIHVYLKDLSHLPYEEQLHWKAFNEKPKAGLSKRAIKTDFEASWDETYSPLQSLKEILKSFPTEDNTGRPCKLWSIPDVPKTRDIRFLNYIVTTSAKEWDDQILALGQILGDGFAKKEVVRLAESLGCRNEKLGPIKQLGLVLERLGYADYARIIGPLAEAWDMRSAAVAHPGKPPRGNLKEQYKSLLQRCDEAMRELARLIKEGFFVQQEKKTEAKA